jgi:hypothetical protein
MAGVGFTSVLGPALLWYSAGQALAAGTMVLAMVAALQLWRARGHWWLLAIGSLAAMAAPLFWTAGYTAGVVGMAYLWADGRRQCRRAAVIPLVVTIATGLLVRGAGATALAPATGVAVQPFLRLNGFRAAVAHSSQAVCEALVINNLGLDATTTAPQSIALGSLLFVLWVWSRRRSAGDASTLLPSANPMEVAGAVLVAASLGMVFAVRGTETTFGNLRALGWYDAIPELGAVLFAAGWWSGQLASPPPTTIEPPWPRELLAVGVFAGAMLVLQVPRVGRVIFEYDGLAAPGPISGRPRTPAELTEQAREQRRALAELDRLEQRARQNRSDLAAIRSEVSRICVPGMPGNLHGSSAIDLLDVSGLTRGAGSDHRESFSSHE